MNKIHSAFKFLLFLLASFLHQSSFAVTECYVTPSSLYIGGDSVGQTNYLWVRRLEGGAAVVYQTDPSYKSLLALVMLARANQRQINVRYTLGGIRCTGTNPSPVLGMWLL